MNLMKRSIKLFFWFKTT